MKVHILYSVTRGYFNISTVRAVYLDSKSARAEADRLNASPYAGRQNRFVVKTITARGEA